MLLLAIFIAVLHAALAITAANTKSPTFDEPQHLTAGYSYFKTNDFRLDPENGNLPAMWAALPLLFDSLNFVPLNDHGWQRAEEGRTAHQFFYELGNDPDQMLRQGRLMMSIFGAALCLLVYRCAREFFGVVGGLIAEIIAAFDPNFLAHSALVDSDVPAALFFTLATWSCWRLFEKITPARLLIAALSFSGLFLTKFSAPIVLPVLGGITLRQIFSGNEIALEFGRFRIALVEKWEKLTALAATWLVLGITVFVAIWGSYSFRYSAWTDDRPSHEGTVWHWNYLLENSGFYADAVSFARTHHLLPEAYLYGFAYVRKHEIDRPAFLDNEWSIIGFRSFFPRAFIYKTTLPVLALAAFALVGATVARRATKIASLANPLTAFALVYAAFAITAQLNIGHRHILPIYPALFVTCGAAGFLLQRRRRTVFAIAVGLLLFWHIGDSFAVRPDYLAYFNGLAGGPKHGYQHLVDSSLDWGQDLPGLKSWLDEHDQTIGRRPTYLAYFGTADPRWYGIEAETLQLGRQQPDQNRLSALRGGIYCVSATTLQSVYAMEIGPWCAAYERRYQAALRDLRRTEANPATMAALTDSGSDTTRQLKRKIGLIERLRFARVCAYLRHERPIAKIGHSIFVFDLKDEQVYRALYRQPVELEAQVLVRGY